MLNTLLGDVLSMKKGCPPSKPFIQVCNVSDYTNPSSDVNYIYNQKFSDVKPF